MRHTFVSRLHCLGNRYITQGQFTIGTIASSTEIPIVVSPSEDQVTYSLDEFLQFLLEIFLGNALKWVTTASSCVLTRSSIHKIAEPWSTPILPNSESNEEWKMEKESSC
jgi:hypothetical protein